MQNFDHLAVDQLMVLALENQRAIDSLARRRDVASASDSRRKLADLKRELSLMNNEIWLRTGRLH